MHKKKMVSCLSAALLLLAQAPAYSAGLGKLTVNSALGQPLNAEIEVLAADPTELASLQARMANAEAYRSANLEMTSVLSGLKFVLDKKPGGRSVLKVTSSKPVNDPFVDMLIELNWGSGQMVREYTLLLDPPGMFVAPQNNRNVTVAPATTTSTAASAAEKPVASDAVSTTKAIPAKPAAVKPVPKAVAVKPVEPAPVAKVEAEPATSNVIASPSTVKIKRGATLSAVAQSVKPEGVKLEQMRVGLYRQNPAAFAGNMNQMKAGKVLKVPSTEEIAAISQAEAVREIKLQADDWHGYRQKLAGEVATAPAAAVKAPSASGKVTPKIEDKAAPVKAGQDVLKLSKGEAPATASKAAGTAKPVKPTAAEQKQAAQDEAMAKQKALKEANERAAALEKNIKDMQRLVELKNQSMANLQKEAAKPAPAAVKPEVKPEVEPVAAVKPAPETVPAPVAAPKKAEVKPAVPAPVAEPAWYEDINPLYAAGGAVGALLLALFGFMAKSRSRRVNLSKFENSIMTNVAAKPNTVYGTQGGAVVNTNNTSFLTDFSQSGLGSLDTHDVDPIAEAEVYMAYGRDAQAEEILKEAMLKDPARHEIKLKLLEIYAGRKNLPAFESISTELYSALAGENSPVWERAA
ncbi:MAG: FimV/HubP family polar landmark protein, partial [Sulfuriferula sp.]